MFHVFFVVCYFSILTANICINAIAFISALIAVNIFAKLLFIKDISETKLFSLLRLFYHKDTIIIISCIYFNKKAISTSTEAENGITIRNYCKM